MKSNPKRLLKNLSNELNELLNVLYEESKRYEKVSEKLIMKNAMILMIRKLKGLLRFRGISGIFIVLIPSWILSETTNAFQRILHLPFSSKLLLSFILIILLVSILRMITLNAMSTIDSDLFHLGVYEKRRKKEYRSLISLAKEKDYIYTIREEVENRLESDTDNEQHVKQQIAEYEEELQRCEEVIKEKDEAIQELLQVLKDTESSADLFKEKYEMLMEFLYELKSKLNLLVNDQFTLDNINFGSNYSLYRVEKTGITFIDAYGINKAEMDKFIPFNQSDNKYIQSLNKTQHDPLIMKDFISWKRTLQDGSDWILSLHLNVSNREKFNLSEEAGKINVTITQELLWICCELLNKYTRKKKKGKTFRN